MLKASPRLTQPAARWGRRFFLFCASLLVLASACAPEAETEGVPHETIRKSALHAIELTRSDFPATSRYIHTLLAAAQSISAGERTALPWNRDRERETAAWDRVAQASWEGTRQSQNRAAAARERWANLEPMVEQQIAQAQESLREGAGLGAREASALQKARYQAILAQNLAKQGEFDGAADAAEQALLQADVVDQGWNALRARFSDRKLLRTWRGWANQTILESKQRGTTAIIVDKLRRELHVYDDGKKVATYAAELGGNGLRPKRHAGDRATPEGRYKVTELRSNGATRYYKALMLDYPNREDVARFHEAQRKGSIPKRVGIGSLIEVHGLGGDGRDWTDGCVALTNKDMDKVFQRTRVGTPVVIVGTL